MTTFESQKQALRTDLSAMLPPGALDTFDDEARRLGLRRFGDAKRLGDTAPDFTLPSALGSDVSLKSALADGPVVLVFYRGSWCPYCNLQLRDYQKHLAEFRAAGARLIAVSPQSPDRSMTFAETAELGFDVLSDAGGAVMDAYGLVFEVEGATRDLMRGLGIDVAEFNADPAWRLPVPAAYVIDRDGRIAFAAVDGDYRNRAEPADLLAAVAALG